MQQHRRQGCIVVTGASRGIGAAIAVALAEAGFHVGCLSRSGDPPARADATPQTRGRWLSAACDITQPDSVRRAFDAIAAAAPVPLIGLVNNAGVHTQAPSATLAMADYQHVMATNAGSVLSTSQIAYPHLRRGSNETPALIVNMGSFFDKLGVKRNLAYCASKAAVAAMTRCLAVEWAGDGIRVMNLAPGYVTTDLNRDALGSGPLRDFLARRIPTGGPGTADDVARLVALLFAEPQPYLTGATLYLDGGHGMAL
ncbi:MAG: SDR family NAD(P)-dependent oxidoreductase [Burkholderiaceae bacterium]